MTFRGAPSVGPARFRPAAHFGLNIRCKVGLSHLMRRHRYLAPAPFGLDFLFERPVLESDPTVDTDGHRHRPVSLTPIGTCTV